jgi:hypothetical protein
MHDCNINKCISLFDFVTTSHTVVSISKFLISLKHKLAFFDKKGEYPQAIVVDFSWTLIDSILEVFNMCDFNQYIYYAYKSIVEDEKFIFKQRIKTVIILCSTHFLRMIVRRVKHKNIKTSSTCLHLFYICVTMLQNSKTYTEFMRNLRDTFIVFNTEKKSPIFDNICNSLQIELNNRKFKQWLPEQSDDIRDESIENEEEFHLIENAKTLFNNHFDIFLSNISSELELVNSSTVLNPYYCPSLFKILKEYLFLMPFWCGILIFDPQITRLHNNYVEEFFDFSKNDILLGSNFRILHKLIKKINLFFIF